MAKRRKKASKKRGKKRHSTKGGAKTKIATAIKLLQSAKKTC